MKRVQHIQVKLEVTLTVQLPTADELKDNIPAYQEPALLHYVLTRWRERVERLAIPNRTDIGVVSMQVERQS